MSGSDGFGGIRGRLEVSPEPDEVCTLLNSSDHDVREMFRRLGTNQKTEALEILKRLKHAEIKEKE
ncbi:hypothetical protein [Methanofollis fontis]|uniref:Uncharacterized protein n=1 Tax=Methanofollis fontis TaxID=2052832 RepID=A0A483CZZ1_9EURY|nr:hypothetical protein [Methanofollis fontis]TAJ45809.1 hypothetical protein CUJ86_03625 [Methanofollis fontis]